MRLVREVCQRHYETRQKGHYIERDADRERMQKNIADGICWTYIHAVEGDYRTVPSACPFKLEHVVAQEQA